MACQNSFPPTHTNMFFLFAVLSKNKRRETGAGDISVHSRLIFGILVVLRLGVAFHSGHLEGLLVASSIVHFVPFGVTFAFRSAVPRLDSTPGLLRHSASDEAFCILRFCFGCWISFGCCFLTIQRGLNTINEYQTCCLQHMMH